MIETDGGSKPEYNDTGLWRQLIIVSSGRLRSWIISRDDPKAAPRLEVDAAWESDSGHLLHHIEDAVYDNPLVLDDFATDILIDTPDVIALPSEAIESPEDVEDAFEVVYGEMNDGIFSSPVTEETTLAFSLLPGLESFFGRTFPGARIAHYMEPAIRHYSAVPGGGTRIFINIHDGRFDIWALRKGRLLMLASRRYTSPADAAYFIFATFHAWDLNPRTDEVSVSGDKEGRAELMSLLRKYINYVTITMLPGIPDRDKLPLPLILQLKNYNSR